LVGEANKQKKNVARKKKKHQTRKKEERKKEKTDATCELCIQAFFANVNKLGTSSNCKVGRTFLCMIMRSIFAIKVSRELQFKQLA
jgi:hypothetical protein